MPGRWSVSGCSTDVIISEYPRTDTIRDGETQGEELLHALEEICRTTICTDIKGLTHEPTIAKSSGPTPFPFTRRRSNLETRRVATRHAATEVITIEIIARLTPRPYHSLDESRLIRMANMVVSGIGAMRWVNVAFVGRCPLTVCFFE